MELVWMANGTKKQIKDVNIGEKVLTFHNETFEITETAVINQFVRNNDFPIYKLKTVSGREIKATADHKFMTNMGWKTVNDMIIDPTIKIGVNMTDYGINQSCHLSSSVILDEDTFVSKLRAIGINESENRKTSKIVNYSEHLKSIGLLPLSEENDKLPILARIIGFMYADGSINVYNKKSQKYQYKNLQSSFDFGNKCDAMQFENDIELCGFNRVKIIYEPRANIRYRLGNDN
jgi:intein/homing endonuclease